MRQWASATLEALEMRCQIRWASPLGPYCFCFSFLFLFFSTCVRLRGKREWCVWANDIQAVYLCCRKSQLPSFPPVCLQILYNQQSVEVMGNLKRKLITQLQPDTDYSFVLTSRGNIAGGLQQQVSIRTAPDLIQTKPRTHHAQGGKMNITLPKIQTTTRVKYVLIGTNHTGLLWARKWLLLVRNNKQVLLFMYTDCDAYKLYIYHFKIDVNTKIYSHETVNLGPNATRVSDRY